MARKKLKYLEDSCRCYGVIQFELHPDNNGEDTLAFETVLMFLQGCAIEHGSLLDSFLALLIRILSRTNGKKNCLQVLGVNDSGKSSLVDLVTGFIPNYYIVNFSIPVSNSVLPFLLQDLVHKEIGRCEEAVIDREDIAQVLNALCEENPNLKVDVKYEGPQAIGKVPIFMTLNGQDKNALTRFISSESENFKARCKIMHMKMPMKDKIQEGCINTMKANINWYFPRYVTICGTIFRVETRNTTSHILNQCVKDIISQNVHDLQ